MKLVLALSLASNLFLPSFKLGCGDSRIMHLDFRAA